jgi:hypothetical protein
MTHLPRRLVLPAATFVIAQAVLGCPTTNTIGGDTGPQPDTRIVTTPDAPSPSPDAAIDPCAAGDVDLLFLVDNSGSMREEQANLISELPRLIRVLSTGDTNGDGLADFNAARSLHVGFVTTDMGSGNQMNVRTCTPGLGDDGILRSRASGVAPCMATYPTGTFAFMDGQNVDAFSATLGCVANIGTSGCGFEQQLEAPLKALTPTNPEAWTRAGYVPPRFYDPASGLPGRLAGHGSAANAGFVRPDSTLAVVLLSDEEDCSVADYGIFGPDPRFTSIPSNLRCSTFAGDSSIVYPTSRYVDGFLGLRRQPSQLVFSVIAGIPPETEALAAAGDFAAVLAHPGMIPRVDASGTNPEPSCSTANGTAYPPVRMVEVAAGLAAQGASVSVSSICSGSFAGPIDSIITRLSTVPSTCD